MRILDNDQRFREKVDGTYTRRLRRVKNISWKDRLSNVQLYSQIPKLSTIITRRRLALAEHVARHNELLLLLLFDPTFYELPVRTNVQLKVIEFKIHRCYFGQFALPLSKKEI